MKEFKNIFLIIIAMLTCISLTTVTIKADSGWDSSYDSSSSWSDSGSSWSSSDSWSSSSYSGGSGSGVGALIVFAVVIIIIIIASKNSNSNRPLSPNLEITRFSVTDDVLTKYGLNREKILNDSFELYKNIQIAWMNFDFNNLRKYLSDELFNTYKMQLNTLKLSKQKNIMEDFTLRKMIITNVTENEGLITITEELLVAQRDYVVDQNNKVVKGTKSRRMLVHYKLTFTITKDTNKGKCPNCNAPLENYASNVCPYCDSTVVTKNHGLVMTKKQNEGQDFE